MTPNNEYFTSERVDEQIEQLQPSNILEESTDEAKLVHALQRHYSVPLIAADHTALEHARQRITGKQSDADITADDTPVVTFHPATPIARPRATRFMRILSGLAAVILVGVLVGSWLVVTHMVGTPATVVPGGPGNLYIIHNGTAYRLDGSSGRVIWQHRLATSKQPDPRVGSSAYLQVVNHVVYAVLDFDIYALDASTGQQIWHVANHTNKSYFWFVVDNGRLYLYSLDSTFSALNAADGSALWHNTTFTTENGYGFSVRNGNLYTQNSTADPNDQKLYTLDGATGKVRWSVPLPQGSLLNAPLVENGTVYYSSGNLVFAVKEQSGERIWEQPVPAAGMLTDVSPAGGILYVNSSSVIMESSTDTRNIYALNAQTGQLLWSAGPGYNTLNVSITNGLLLAAREHNGVYSIAGLDARTGKATWQVPFQCAVYHFGPKLLYPECSALWTEAINGKFYLLESDGQPLNKRVYTLKSFDAGTGQLLAEHPLAIEQDNPVAIGASNGLLYLQINVPRIANTISYTDYVFVAYHLSDGTTMWRHTMPPFPAPTSANTAPGTSRPVLAP
ncbi:MAG TPA: PQQ-binding-like beta-propeller repeat protein [Ktedonobacteraceae bacterium]|nr:PQQ-binding-like beta-propeller repeat protein [Ktedonobacteraceae bacterium]